MEYLIIRCLEPDVDEPFRIYSEMDENRRETRRVELYDGGFCFPYGEETENAEALRQEPFPQDLRELEEKGKIEVLPCAAHTFLETWETALCWPNGAVMGQLF